MPMGEGWWIAPDGEVIRIHEHLRYIEEHPERFGFTPEELKPRDEDERRRRGVRRGRILREAFRRGFVRVRMHGGRNVFEFRGWERSRRLIEGFLDEVGMKGSEAALTLRDHASGREWTWRREAEGEKKEG